MTEGVTYLFVTGLILTITGLVSGLIAVMYGELEDWFFEIATYMAAVGTLILFMVMYANK